MTSYTGVDVTPEALDVAARSIAALGVPPLVAADFTVELPRLPGPYDTIVVSLAMHHLPADDKPAFFAAARARLAAGGLLLVYEPSCRPSEGRARYVARQAAYFTAHFTRMTPEQVADAQPARGRRRLPGVAGRLRGAGDRRRLHPR